MRKHSEKVNKAMNTKLRYLLPVFIFFLLLSVTIVVQNQRSARVLGEQTEQKGGMEIKENPETKETVEQAEPTEAPDSVETPEQENERNREADRVHQEVEKEIQNGTVEKVEVQGSPEKSGEGKLKIQNTNGPSTEKTVQPSAASLISVQNSQTGTVSVSVNKNGTVTLINNGITIQTSYPVVIDPKSQTIGVKTPTGVTVINAFPSQVLSGVQAADKPAVVHSAILEMQNGEAYYDIKGIQERRFLGLIPVTANVEAKINAQNGSMISINKPWYLNSLGFLYSI